MKQWIADLFDAHGWKILGLVITTISTLIGGSVAYGVHIGEQQATQQVTQRETATYQAAQEKFRQDLSEVKQDVSEMKGTMNTILMLIRGRK